MKHIVLPLFFVLISNFTLLGQSDKTFTTTKKIAITREVITTINEDSLIYEKCQLFNDPSFLEQSSLKITTSFYMNDDGSLLIEDEEKASSDQKELKIHNSMKGVQIHLYDFGNKVGSMSKLRESNRNAFEGYTWNSSNKGEVINGWDTEIMTGTKSSFMGDEAITIWYTKDFELPEKFSKRLFPNPEAKGVPVKLEQVSLSQCYRSTMTVLMGAVSDEEKLFDFSDWSIEDQTSVESYAYEEEYNEETSYEQEMTEEYTDEEVYEESFATLIVDGKEYNLSYDADWLFLPVLTAVDPLAYDQKKKRGLYLFEGSVGDRKIAFDYPDSLFLFTDEYREEKSIWLASEAFESYRYYPESVPIYSRTQIAVRISPVEIGNNDLLLNFKEKRNELEINGIQVAYGERYYMNEESRAIHSVRYVFTQNGDEYVIDGFQELGSDYTAVFFELIESMLIK